MLMITDEVKDLFIKKYREAGYDKFYRFLITYSLDKVSNPKTKSITPEIELMGYYDKFLQLYHRENEPIYLEIAKQFRRAANKVYRILLKTDKTQFSNKFLNVIEK